MSAQQNSKLLAGVKLALLLAVVTVATPGCSIKRMAVNKLGDALAHQGTTFASDDDPDLVRDAMPFALKLMEGLLAEAPTHQGLLSATASGFTQYSYAFVNQDADEKEEESIAAAEALRTRARRMYLRARNYGLRGLDAAHPGFDKLLRADPKKAVMLATRRDVPLLFWTAAAWGAAVSTSKDNPDLIADVPIVEALIDRALELDEVYDGGGIHAFLITFEMARRGATSDPAMRAKKHFDRAMELARGTSAAPLVAYAEAVCIQKQDRTGFESLLKQALAIDPDAAPDKRLANLIAQRRARWLLSRTSDLFVEPEPKAQK
jgi:predicted anti-sigma-YlaC factor YlaD